MERNRGRATKNFNGRQFGGAMDELAHLRLENHYLRLEMGNAYRHYEHESNKANAAVEKLKMQLIKARNEIGHLEKTRKMLLTEKSTQTEDKDVTELFLQLQLAHQSLEQYVVQSHPFTENEEYLRGWRAILEISVKLQQEQLHLMERVFALAPCIDSGGHAAQWGDVDELEQLNMHLQKLHVMLMEQALMRTSPKKTCCRPEQSQSSGDDGDQDDEIQDLEMAPSITVLQSAYEDLEEKAARAQNDREDYMRQIQDLKVKLLEAEVKLMEKEAVAEELNVKLFKVSSGVKNNQANRRDAGTMTAGLDSPASTGDTDTGLENEDSQKGAKAPAKPPRTFKSGSKWLRIKEQMKKWKVVTRLKNLRHKDPGP